MSSGFIYLIECNSDGNISYKIGKTIKKVEERLKQMSTGNPGNLSVVHTFNSNNVNTLEKTLHRHYAHHNIRGEWFTDKIEIDRFMEICETYEKAISGLSEINEFI